MNPVNATATLSSNTGSLTNEYDVGSGVTLRSNRLVMPPPTVRIQSSFIRQLTEDFVIPLTSLTLLEKIGEGIYIIYSYLAKVDYLFVFVCPGEFGIVYKARLLNANRINEMVAVKTLKGNESTGL